MKKQAGFTLIELVMVIVILGVLSAVALPKFVDLGKDARTAAIKAVEGSMRSANAIIYAKAAVGNQMGATGTVTISGTSVATVYGFASTAATLASAMDLTATDFDTTVAGEIQHKGGATPASCKVVYVPAASAIVAPTYTQTIAGC
jgi:MSHA pilin protein MshA